MSDEGFEQPIEGSGSTGKQDSPPIPMPGVPGSGTPLPPMDPWVSETMRSPNDQLPPSAPPTSDPGPIPTAGPL